ncbi:MAG TPA: hydroxyacid dehydrogenase [Clostridiaceae bacterium]|jgi:phosphoglycerate dehydrogenase-like enzyme|nr:hydroxyacid dehydrogenase [Clostridiaceae bacterium]
MKITLIEPLAISEDLLFHYKEKMEKAGHEFVYYTDKAKTEEEFLERSKDAEILMIANTPLPDSVIAQAENLKLINVAFTGFDHVNVKFAAEKGIKVCNAAGYSNTSVAELVIGMVINIYRMLNESDRATREEKTPADFYTGMEIKDKTVGIIGTGKIGLETARLFQAFGAKVIAASRTEKQDAIDMGIRYVSIENLMKESDIVSLHLAMNEHTRGFINKDLLQLMKEDAIFINCARGPIVDNQALADLLNAGKIAFAGIDVFDMEPPIPSDYPLIQAKNVLLTPHIAFLTKEAMVRRAAIAFDNSLSFACGEEKNIVN